MARFAIISDLHSNIEALGAVLARLDREGIERIVCLGDVVGYGPDPEHCIDLVMQRCQLTLLGNHDEALLRGAHDFTPVARQVIEYNRRMLKPTLYSLFSGLPLGFRREEKVLIGGEVRWRPSPCSLHLGLCNHTKVHRATDRGHNCLGNLGLHGKNILSRALPAVGPDMGARLSIDQLSRSANALALPLDRAF